MISVRKAKYEDMALAASIMVTSFRTAFAAFVSSETIDACANPEHVLGETASPNILYFGKIPAGLV